MKILKHLSLPLLATFCVSASPLSSAFAAETVSKEMELVTFRTSFRTVGGLLETEMRYQSPPFTIYGPIPDKDRLTFLSESQLADIGKFLSPVDFTHFCLVCKKPGQSGKISRKAFTLGVSTSKEWLDHLDELKRIPELTIWGCESLSRVIEDENIGLYIRHLSHNITRIYLKDSRRGTSLLITDNGFKHIGTLANLQELALQTSKLEVTDEGFKHIGTLVNLKKLELSFQSEVTGVGFQYLRKLSALESLQLSNSERVIEEGIQPLCGLPNLRQLELSKIWEMSDAALQHLSGLLTLERLRLKDLAKVTDGGIQHLSSLPNLQQLELILMREVTDRGIQHLRGLLALERLRLEDLARLTDGSIQHLSGLPNLRQLELEYMDEITDDALHHLSGLPALESLRLNILKRVTDEGIQHLSGLPNLRQLELSNILKVSDAGLQHLSSLPALRQLELRRIQKVTGAGLQRLSLSTLENLTLCDLERITSMPLLKGLPALRELTLKSHFFSLELTNADLQQLARLLQLKHITLKTEQGLLYLHRVA
jgi:hypothetical protein